MNKNQKAGETPEKITVSMIDQDLKDGVNKSEMAVKYGIKPWEVDEMFKHPLLKGRRPSRKKALSFSFVDDVTTNKTRYVSEDLVEPAYEIKEEVEIANPDQVTLEDAIEEATVDTQNAITQMHQTQEAITEMLSPTEYETPEETLLKTTVSDTNEEELEMDDNTFEL